MKALSLFGWSSGSFPVPVEPQAAVARSRGQGRPPGRRGQRLVLDGGEPGRSVFRAGYGGSPRRAKRAVLAFMFCVVVIVPVSQAVASTRDLTDTTTPSRAVIAAAVDEAALRFGLPKSWIEAVMLQESGGVVRAVSPKGAMGLLQLMPETWRAMSAEHGLGVDPFEPRANILAGAAYLRRMYDQFGAPGFLAAYNAGPGRYARYLSGGANLPLETQVYLRRLSPLVTGVSEIVPPVAPADWRASGLFPAPEQAFDGTGRKP